MAFQNSFRWRLVLTFVGATCCIFVSSCNSNSSSKSSEDGKPLSGKELYLQNCAVCHGDDGKLGTSGAKDLTQSTLSDNEVIKRINEGKNAMPPMKEALETKENISAVAEYIKGMRK
jgi:mono/diheme cytochrome c family protein